MSKLRGVLLYFAIAAFVLTFGVMVLRRVGVIAETVAVLDRQTGEARDLRLITLLPRDGIPAIFDPTFVSAEEGARQLRDDDLVIGVSIDGDHRAYGVANLSSHEVVNDTVGGKPIAVTW